MQAIKFSALLFLIPALAIGQAKHQKAIQKSLKNKSVEISQDTVFYSGEAWFTVSENAGSNAFVSSREIKTFAQKSVVSITKMANGTYGISSTFFVKFVSITDTASLTKGGGFEGCLQTLFENKIFMNKEVDMAAAKKFVQQYKYVAPVYVAATYDGYGTNTNTSYNSTTPSSTNNNSQGSNNTTTQPKPQQPPAPASVSFTLKNNGSKTVKIFIGTKPKYGSGRTTSLGGNTRTSEHGKPGDQLCVVDDSGNPISCMTISQSMGTIYINSKGTGFGDN